MAEKIYNVDIEISLNRAHAIKHAISMLQIKYGAQNVGPIAISMGICMYPLDGNPSDELIEAADKALYFSKKSGRNKITLFSEMGNPTNKET